MRRAGRSEEGRVSVARCEGRGNGSASRAGVGGSGVPPGLPAFSVSGVRSEAEYCLETLRLAHPILTQTGPFLTPRTLHNGIHEPLETPQPLNIGLLWECHWENPQMWGERARVPLGPLWQLGWGDGEELHLSGLWGGVSSVLPPPCPGL